MTNWIPDVGKTVNESIVKILVGNKNDLKNER